MKAKQKLEGQIQQVEDPQSNIAHHAHIPCQKSFLNSGPEANSERVRMTAQLRLLARRLTDKRLKAKLGVWKTEDNIISDDIRGVCVCGLLGCGFVGYWITGNKQERKKKSYGEALIPTLFPDFFVQSLSLSKERSLLYICILKNGLNIIKRPTDTKLKKVHYSNIQQ